MSARSFTSSGTSRIAFAIGASTFTGDMTIMAITRRTTNAILHVVFYVGTATSGAARIQYAIDGSNNHNLRLGASTQALGTLTVADGWACHGVTRTAGTTTPRFHRYIYSSNTWAHGNAPGTLGDPTTPSTTCYIGDWSSGGDAWGGDIQMVGYWNAVLTDVQIENLAFDLSAWYQVPPKGLWILDQETTSQSVPDTSGNGSNQSGIVTTGMGISAVSTPIWTPGQAVIAS